MSGKSKDYDKMHTIEFGKSKVEISIHSTTIHPHQISTRLKGTELVHENQDDNLAQ